MAVLFAAATATHGDKEDFDREVRAGFSEEPDDMAAAQLHMAAAQLQNKPIPICMSDSVFSIH